MSSLLSSGVECQQGWPPLQIPRVHDYQSQIAEHTALETIILIVIVNVCLSFLRIVRPVIHHILNGNCNFIGTKTLLKLNWINLNRTILLNWIILEFWISFGRILYYACNKLNASCKISMHFGQAYTFSRTSTWRWSTTIGWSTTLFILLNFYCRMSLLVISIRAFRAHLLDLNHHSIWLILVSVLCLQLLLTYLSVKIYGITIRGDFCLGNAHAWWDFRALISCILLNT